MPPQDKERPGRRNDRANPTQGDSVPRESALSISGGDDRYRADARWCANLERMARRAAADPEFYEIAGGTVQYLADDIKTAVA